MPVSNNAARHRVSPPRLLRYAGLAGAGIAAAVALAPVPAATAAPAVAASPAATAVRALTSPEPAASIPADFPAVAGYRPEVADGLLVAPHGSCSSPVPLPVEFETACKAHDLGYDLLRYADRTGAPLGPWARREVDRALADRMRAACAHRVEVMARMRCAGMAEVATAAVGLNSLRQSYGVPVVERFPVIGGEEAPRMAGLLAAALVAALLTGRTTASGPRRRTRRPIERTVIARYPISPASPSGVAAKAPAGTPPPAGAASTPRVPATGGGVR
ncbi:hypothetical protein [Nocardia sp. NPDC003345]